MRWFTPGILTEERSRQKDQEFQVYLRHRKKTISNHTYPYENIYTQAHIHIYTHAHTQTHAKTYIQMSTYAYIHAYIHIHMHAHKYTQHIHTYTNTCIHTYMHKNMHMSTHMHTYAHIHICTCIYYTHKYDLLIWMVWRLQCILDYKELTFPTL